MKGIRIIHAIVLAGLFAVGPAGSAQPGMGKYQQLYTTGSIVTVSGVVQSVYSDTPPGVRIQAVYLSLKTDAESIPVQLGPESFNQKLPTKFDKGDKIEVTGARVTVEGKTMILVAQVKKGAESVVFRNSSGVPVWSGQ
jgi:hypothetical protein